MLFNKDDMLFNKDDMLFNKDDMRDFINNIWTTEFLNNNGGMGAPDLFTLWFILNKYKPKVVVESGVWNGISTKLIRKTLPDSKIICLDPREISANGFKDNNNNTEYYLGYKFIDFNYLDLSKYNKDDILCFFDCHQNAYLRVMQCLQKKITKIFLNDNYPVYCGSHYTIEHLINNDNRLYSVNNSIKNRLIKLFEIYHVFPNIYPGSIKTGEGYFNCNSYFENENDDNNEFLPFKNEKHRYRWNTFIKLKENTLL